MALLLLERAVVLALGCTLFRLRKKLQKSQFAQPPSFASLHWAIQQNVCTALFVGVSIESSVILQIFPTRLTRVHYILCRDSGVFQRHVMFDEVLVEFLNG